MTPSARQPKPQKTVVTIGGAMIDTIAVIDNDLIERMSMNNADRAFMLLEEGRKTEADVISTHAGGGAINSAVCFARLGHAVSTVVKLGRDTRAQAIKEALRVEGISAAHVIDTDAAGTGASVLISAHERNAAIFTFRGANSLLELQDLPGDGFARDIVYITGLSDRSADVFPEIVQRAASHDAFIAANPGIRQLAARGDEFQKALAHISLLSMNRDEAAVLVPRLMQQQPKPARMVSPAPKSAAMELMHRGLSAYGFEMSLPHFCEALLALGPRCILVTDGKHGAYAAASGEIAFCPSLASTVVGTAGAGDAFTSTFTSHFASGTAIGDALQYAAINASSVVGFADTQSGLLERSALDAAFSAGSSKIAVSSWAVG